MDTFLEQARHWLSTEAGHHHHHSPPPRQSHSPILHQHQQPPAPLSPPVLPNQPPPRSIGEAVSRCVTAENRAISLQAALDRYAAQSEIMEKQVESLSSAMKQELDNVTADHSLVTARAVELEGTASALRSQLEALESALVETRAWAAEADAGRVRAESSAIEARAHAEKAWEEATSAIATCAAAEEEARSARAQCQRCEERVRECEESVVGAQARERGALERAVAAESEVVVMRKELDRLRLERSNSAVQALSLRTSVAAGVTAAALNDLDGTNAAATATATAAARGEREEEWQGEGEREVGGGVGGGVSTVSPPQPYRSTTTATAAASAAPSHSLRSSNGGRGALSLLRQRVSETMGGDGQSQSSLPLPTWQGSSRRFVIEVMGEGGEGGEGGSGRESPRYDLDSEGGGQEGVSLRPIPSASMLVAVDGGEERMFPANRVLLESGREGLKEEFDALASTVASGSSALVLLASAPSMAPKALHGAVEGAAQALFTYLDAFSPGASVDMCVVRQALGSSSESGGGGGVASLEDVFSTRDKQGAVCATLSLEGTSGGGSNSSGSGSGSGSSNSHSPLSLSAHLLSQATHIPVASPSDVTLLASVGLTQAASLEAANREEGLVECGFAPSSSSPSSFAGGDLARLAFRSHLVIAIRVTHTKGAFKWTSHMFIAQLGSPGWVGLGALPFPPLPGPPLRLASRVRAEAQGATGVLGGVRGVLASLAREDRRERALKGAAAASIRLKGRAAPATVAAAAATAAAAASPTLVEEGILRSHPLLLLLSPALLANDSTRQLLLVSLPHLLTYAQDADALTFLMLGAACMGEGIMSSTLPAASAFATTTTTVGGVGEAGAQQQQQQQHTKTSRQPQQQQQQQRVAVKTPSKPTLPFIITPNPALKGATLLPKRRKSVSIIAAATTPKSRSASPITQEELLSKWGVGGGGKRVGGGEPSEPISSNGNTSSSSFGSTGFRPASSTAGMQQPVAELAALDAAIAAEAHSLADLHDVNLSYPVPRPPQQQLHRQQQQQQVRMPPPPPPPPSSSTPPLVLDPVPGMRSLLTQVAPHFPRGLDHHRGLGVNGEGWSSLRGHLAALAGAEGVLSGPELAAGLAKWAPSAFPSGAHSAWSYVVGMGVAYDAAIDASDFVVGLEGLYRSM